MGEKCLHKYITQALCQLLYKICQHPSLPGHIPYIIDTKNASIVYYLELGTTIRPVVCRIKTTSWFWSNCKGRQGRTEEGKG